MAERDISALRIDPAAKQDRPRRWLAPMIVVVALAVAGGWWLLSRPEVIEVRVGRAVAVGAGGPAAVLNASGYVTPRRRATVSSKITGKLVEVRIEEGVAVEIAEVLARLDATDARAALDAAEAELDVAIAARDELAVELEEAQRDHRRATALQSSGVASEDDLDRAKTRVAAAEAALARAGAQIDSARAQVALTRRQVENTVIRAPFAGVVVSKDAQPGEMVSPVSAGGGYTRTGIATIVDMASLEIEVDVNESYIARVSPGQLVDAVLDAYPDWHVPASVIAVIPTADRQKATVQVRIGFDELDPRILPDMGVRVSFLETERPATGPDATPGAEAEESIRVPRSAVVERDGQDGPSSVFVVRNDRAERQAVLCGREVEGAIEILSGLRPGDQVILDPAPQLENGSIVRIISGSEVNP